MSVLEKANKNLYLTFLLVGVLTVFMAIVIFTKCGSQKVIEKEVPGAPQPNPTDPGPTTPPLPTDPPLPPCAKPTFEENLKPILQVYCVSCHSTPVRFDDYRVAAERIDEWIRRVNLNSEDPRRMPKAPKPELSPEQKGVFQGWLDGGMQKSKADCNQELPADKAGLDLAYIEQQINADLARLERNSRPFIRYLVATHKAIDERQLVVSKKATDKALNSLTVREADITLTTPIDPYQTIYRLDLRSYEMTKDDWKEIEKFDKQRFISNTDLGVVIRFLVGTQIPWMHFDNFIDIVNANSNLYYFLNETPRTFYELTAKLGVNFNDDIRQFKATFLGFNGSEISNQKNRLMIRHDVNATNGGYFWTTFDIKPLGNVAQRNLFAFPLLSLTGSSRVFKYDAGEIIYSLANGLQGYSLFDSLGNRQNFAPIDIVRDTRSPVAPFGPEIHAPVSCHRCHSGGVITARDQVRNHVLANASQFDVNDIERVKNLYKRQASLDAIFTVDNTRFQAALSKLNINGLEPDPISVARDFMLGDYDLPKVAASLFLSVDKFKELLQQSGRAKEIIGQLANGDTITHDQFVAALPVIFRDFRLLEQPINGG